MVLAASIAAAAMMSATAGAAESPAAFVRVNQVGYAPTAAKRAYVIASVSDTGAPFRIERSDGTTAMTGNLGVPAGTWSSSFPDVHTIDFDQVQASGSYRIILGGAAPASSPLFQIAPAQALYGTPLRNALSFYENERDGPEFIPSPLRTAPGHLNDATAMTYATPKVNTEGSFKKKLRSLKRTIDASGGWWDAGDYLKFVQTTSYTVDEMLAGVRDFPAQMGPGSSADFTSEARFGVEWLLRMWDDATGTLFYQVGIGSGNRLTASDHDIWRLPQADDGFGGQDPLYRYIRHRPVFRAGPPGSKVSPNIAGRDAAAFGLCFQVFKDSDLPLAERCLRAGEHIFGLADTHPRHQLLTAIPFSFYPEREWRDDLELGATELADALSSATTLPGGLPHAQPAFYLGQAASWAGQYIEHARHSSDSLNLYDVSGLAHFELVRALRAAGSPSGLAVGESGLVADLRRELSVASEQAQSDPFGFGFPWASADTASHGNGLAVMAGEYDELTGQSAFANLGERWLGNVLGANAWGASLIVGDGTVYPSCPSHQLANLLGSLDGTPPVLAGAVVEGPSDEASSGEVAGMRPCPAGGTDEFPRFDNSAVFADNEQSYTTVEPAIDLTASSMLAFAWQIAPPRPIGG